MPDPVKCRVATRIARLETLAAALEDALRETGDLLFDAQFFGLSDVQKARARDLSMENATLRGSASYLLGEGRTL